MDHPTIRIIYNKLLDDYKNSKNEYLKEIIRDIETANNKNNINEQIEILKNEYSNTNDPNKIDEISYNIDILRSMLNSRNYIINKLKEYLNFLKFQALDKLTKRDKINLTPEDYGYKINDYVLNYIKNNKKSDDPIFNYIIDITKDIIALDYLNNYNFGKSRKFKKSRKSKKSKKSRKSKRKFSKRTF